MTTEIIDKLFLELSQVTQARTAKEIALSEYVHECATDRDDRISPGMKRKANELLDHLYPQLQDVK